MVGHTQAEGHRRAERCIDPAAVAAAAAAVAAAAEAAASATGVAVAGAGRPTQSVDCSDPYPAKQHRRQVVSVCCARCSIPAWRCRVAQRCDARHEGTAAHSSGTYWWSPSLILWRPVVGRAWLCHASAILRLVVFLRVRTLTSALQALSSATFPSVAHRSCSSGRRENPTGESD